MASQIQMKNVVIVGGSLGGLFVGVALKALRKDLNIRIFERSPTASLQSQGAGIVASQDVQKFFEQHDQTRTAFTVTSQHRMYLDKAGECIHREHRVQQMTNWALVYRLLRKNFDETTTDNPNHSLPGDAGNNVSYEHGCTVTGLDIPHASSSLKDDCSNQSTLTVKRESGEEFTVAADLIIAADGPSSTIRSIYFPEVKREYAEYVAWRGTVPEADVSEASTQFFVENFTFFDEPGVQILAYTIPGESGTLEPGKRIVNWVWYANYKKNSPEHVELMTDKDGERRHISMPGGKVKNDVWIRQKQYAKDILPPHFAEIVGKTQEPFIQEVTDVIAPSAVLEDGRVILVGDALAGFRPHTAMSTGQAARNAMTLADTIRRMIEGEGAEALSAWEDHAVKFAKQLQSHGVWVGNRSQFLGVDP